MPEQFYINILLKCFAPLTSKWSKQMDVLPWHFCLLEEAAYTFHLLCQTEINYFLKCIILEEKNTRDSKDKQFFQTILYLTSVISSLNFMCSYLTSSDFPPVSSKPFIPTLPSPCQEGDEKT